MGKGKEKSLGPYRYITLLKVISHYRLLVSPPNLLNLNSQCDGLGAECEGGASGSW